MDNPDNEAGSMRTEKLLLTYEELSALTGISVPSLKRQKKAGTIRPVPLGGRMVRFDPKDFVGRPPKGADKNVS